MKTLKELIQQEQGKARDWHGFAVSFERIDDIVENACRATAKAVGELVSDRMEILDFEHIDQVAIDRALKTFLGEEGV